MRLDRARTTVSAPPSRKRLIHRPDSSRAGSGRLSLRTTRPLAQRAAPLNHSRRTVRLRTSDHTRQSVVAVVLAALVDLAALAQAVDHDEDHVECRVGRASGRRPAGPSPGGAAVAGQHRRSAETIPQEAGCPRPRGRCGPGGSCRAGIRRRPRRARAGPAASP